VAAGLHKLDWTLETASRDSSSAATSSSSSGGGGGGRMSAGQQLAQCRSKLQDLQLRGDAWTQDDVGAAAALRQLTGLTSFGLHCVRAPVSTTAMELGSWPSQPPLQHLKQLRSLAVPVELLTTQQPWLGGLVHLTRLQLQLAVGWCKRAAGGGWVPQDVFGGAQGKVQANLVSCWPGLKVLAVHFDLLYGPRGRQQDVQPVVPAVQAWLREQLPGVQLVLTWRADRDRSQEPHIHLGKYYRDRSPQYTADRGSSQDAMASLMADSLDVPLHMAMYSDESEDDLDDLFDKYLDLVMNK
jgi:hypothetical protein